MKELVINQPTKNIVRTIQKMIGRRSLLEMKDISKTKLRLNEKLNGDESKLYYEIIQKGTYTACILMIDNEIVGIGMTKRSRFDKYNVKVASDVSIHKAVKDYLLESNLNIYM